ncbi:MAG TPA: MerR family transcriptional regulator [Lactobacillaceae bacterium]|jgi:DNA-binding transcriptional MerR regulator
MISLQQAMVECEISVHTIRYYEKEGLLKIGRNARGIREFDERTFDRLKTIVHFRRSGIPVKSIKQIFANARDEDMIIDVLETAEAHIVTELAQLTETLEHLRYKIDLHKSGAWREQQAGNN